MIGEAQSVCSQTIILMQYIKDVRGQGCPRGYSGLAAAGTEGRRVVLGVVASH